MILSNVSPSTAATNTGKTQKLQEPRAHDEPTRFFSQTGKASPNAVPVHKVKHISWQIQLLADLHASNQHIPIHNLPSLSASVSQGSPYIQSQPAACKSIDYNNKIADDVHVLVRCSHVSDLIRCQYILEVDTGRYRQTISQSASPRNRSPFRRSSCRSAEEWKAKTKRALER